MKKIKTDNKTAFAEANKSLLAKIDVIHKEIMANPNADGWLRLCEILLEAKQDKRIVSSGGASGFLDLVFEIASDSFTAPTAEHAIKPLEKILTEKYTENLGLGPAVAAKNKKERTDEYHGLWRKWAEEHIKQHPYSKSGDTAYVVKLKADAKGHTLVNGNLYKVGHIEKVITGTKSAIKNGS